MRAILRIAVHAIVFGGVYYGAKHYGMHGEVPYVIAAVATGMVAHFMYRRHYGRLWRRHRW